MKKSNKWLLALGTLMLIPLCAVLFSFTTYPGGDSFTVFINDKMVIQQYVHMDKSVKTFSLNDASSNDVVKVNYSHCGKIGTARRIVLRDAQKSLKELSYNNVRGDELPTMSVRVGDIVALKKSSINLVYYSNEIPEGKILANIAVGNDVKASLK
jgi:hypothetical protein